MKQVLELRKAGAMLALDRMVAERPSEISDADLDKVSGGGGARGGIIERKPPTG